MKLSDAQWQIMKALWADYPATARQIAQRLPAHVNWAYTTIKTMLSRMVEKNIIRETKQGKTSVYEPLLTRHRARRSALKNLANQAFDGAFGPLMHFLLEEQGISEKQRAELIELIQNNHQPKGHTND